MILTAFHGFCMALADSVPGVSGGTVAYILGFYERFLDALHDLFRSRGPARRAALGVILGNGLLKHLVAHPRPCWLDQSVPLLIANPTDYSFPSGHALSSVIGATVLTGADRRFGYAAIPLAALIAFSRLYLYVHFPSDILGAVLLGLGIGLLALRGGSRLLARLPRKCAYEK